MCNELLKRCLEIINGNRITGEFGEEDFFLELKKEGFELVYMEDAYMIIDKHRWYELWTAVYQVKHNGEFIGFIKGKIGENLYSEGSSWSDVYVTYEFKEAKATEVTRYVYNYVNEQEGL